LLRDRVTAHANQISGLQTAGSGAIGGGV